MTRPLVPIPLARGSHGAVVAPHHLASAAGLGILRAGGSAVDAAIATNAVLAVVDGNACGIGGDAFWLIWDAAARRQSALNGSGRSSVRADAAALRRQGLERLPARGGPAVTVPGAVRSWGDAHDRFGRLSRAEILAPAIELALDGFPAWDGFIGAVERSASLFASVLGRDAAWFDVYRPHGRAWRPGERVRLPALGATLSRIADLGWDEFYAGQTADDQARTLDSAGSLIGRDDLAAHRSTWTEPIGIDYRGVRATSHPPNSSGFVALEILDDPRAVRAASGGDVRGRHRRRPSLDPPRDRGLEAGDGRPGCAPDRPRRVAGSARTAPRSRLRGRARRTDRSGPGGPTAGGDRPARRRHGLARRGRCRRQRRQPHRVELHGLRLGRRVPPTGIAYQNRGSYFSLDADHPNVLAPSKRTLHTLLPGMLFRDGRPWVVLGSMGGDAQPQIHAQVVSALVDGGVDVATAVGMPRWFVEPAEHFAPPDTVRAEPRFRPGLLDGLEELGHPVARTAAFDSGLGHCHAIELVDGGPGQDGTLAAATDPRSAGLPAVW